MDEEQATFKVTDRRLFNADGSPRDLPPAVAPEPAVATPAIDPPGTTNTEQVSEPPPPPPAHVESAPVAQEAMAGSPAENESEFTEADIPDAHDPAGFVNFAMSIASNAASALGMMEHPVTHKREIDLEIAKHWIDVLGMLQTKTTGNLLPPEAQILESWLSELRMHFVSLSSTAGKKAPAFTGRDIIGGK